MGGQGFRRIAAAGLVAAALIGLSACGSDRERPSATLPPTSAPTSSSTETPAPTATSGPNGVVPIPVPAPEASAPDELGAYTFQVYWIQTLDYAYATLDVGPLAAASAPECSLCFAGIVDFLGPRAEQGYLYEGGRFTILNTEVLEAAPGTEATVSSIVSISELRVTDPAGNPDPDSGPAQPQYQLFNTLVWRDGGWLVMDANGGPL